MSNNSKLLTDHGCKKKDLDIPHTQAAITVYVSKEEKQLIKDMAGYFGKRNVSRFMLDLALSKSKFINDLVRTNMKEMLAEIIDEASEKADDLFGDQSDNRRATMSFKINLAAESDTVIEVKTPCELVEAPAIPAKKIKFSRVRKVDIKQGRLELKEPPDDDYEEEDQE